MSKSTGIMASIIAFLFLVVKFVEGVDDVAYNPDDYIYHIIHRQTTLTDAINYCEKLMSMSLVTIHSEKESNYVSDLVYKHYVRTFNSSITYILIGFTDDNESKTFKWIDNIESSYTNWNIKPENKNDGKTCATLSASGLWIAKDCNDRATIDGLMCKRKKDKSYKPNDFTYHIAYHQKTTYQKAKVYCNKMSMSLASINTIEEMNHVQNLIYDGDMSRWSSNSPEQLINVMLGSKYDESEKKYYWDDGTEMKYNYWKEDTMNENDLCVVVLAKFGLLGRVSCGKEVESFLCKATKKVGEYNPDWFYYDYDKYRNYPYDEAKSYCESKGMSIASIHSHAENDYLRSKGMVRRGSVSELWIGYTKKYSGEYKWLDKSEENFTFWRPSDVTIEQQKCVELYLPTGEWKTRHCTDNIPFICKFKKVYECGDGTSCKNNEECNTSVFGRKCECKTGFLKVQESCQDIDECKLSTLNNCGELEVCRNNDGGFKCDCKSGYSRQGTECKDVDECVKGNHQCHKFASCLNTVGSYECECKKGFTGNGIQCTDVDECSDSFENDCDQHADCINTEGSYECKCKTGFHGDGESCLWYGSHRDYSYYPIISNEMDFSWDGADAECKLQNMNLLSLHSDDESKYVVSLMKSFIKDVTHTRVWIGAGGNPLTWTDGTIMNYTYFLEGHEMSLLEGMNEKIALHTSTRRWERYPHFTKLNGFICKSPKKIRNYDEDFVVQASYNEKLICCDIKMYPISIHSKEENDKFHSTKLGLSFVHENYYSWEDKTSFSYENWQRISNGIKPPFNVDKLSTNNLGEWLRSTYSSTRCRAQKYSNTGKWRYIRPYIGHVKTTYENAKNICLSINMTLAGLNNHEESMSAPLFSTFIESSYWLNLDVELPSFQADKNILYHRFVEEKISCEKCCATLSSRGWHLDDCRYAEHEVMCRKYECREDVDCIQSPEGKMCDQHMGKCVEDFHLHVYVPVISKYYNGFTFFEAVDICHQHDMEIASIHGPGEKMFIYDALRRTPYFEEGDVGYWIGLVNNVTKVGSSWYDGSVMAYSYINYNGDRTATKNCGTFRKYVKGFGNASQPFMEFERCSVKQKGFVCKRKKGLNPNEHYSYLPVIATSRKYNFSDAVQKCKELSLTLVSVHSVEEQEYLLKILRYFQAIDQTNSEIWIGLKFDFNLNMETLYNPQPPPMLGGSGFLGTLPPPDYSLVEKQFIWLDHTSLFYQNWDIDQLSNPHENPCVFFSADDGKWKNGPCNKRFRGFFCKQNQGCSKDCGVGDCVIDENSNEKCLCPANSKLNEENSCVDVNECENQPCGEGSCTNIMGGYHCNCHDNYAFDGKTCQKIGPNSECEKNSKKDTCKCLPGYQADGIYCKEPFSAGLYYYKSFVVPSTPYLLEHLEQLCLDNFMHLASIQNQEELKYMQDLIEKWEGLNEQSKYWIGLYFENNTYNWTDKVLFNGDTSIVSQSPTTTERNCFYITISSEGFTPQECNQVTVEKFICKKHRTFQSNLNEHQLFAESDISYENAKFSCESKDMKLSSVLDPEEMDMIAEKVKSSSGKYWIGVSFGFDIHGGIVWEDGNPFSYHHWNVNEPSTSLTKTCVYLQGEEWFTGDCHLQLDGYICKGKSKDSLKTSGDILNSHYSTVYKAIPWMPGFYGYSVDMNIVTRFSINLRERNDFYYLGVPVSFALLVVSFEFTYEKVEVIPSIQVTATDTSDIPVTEVYSKAHPIFFNGRNYMYLKKEYFISCTKPAADKPVRVGIEVYTDHFEKNFFVNSLNIASVNNWHGDMFGF